MHANDFPSTKLLTSLPDFLVIAPAKTGSTWLAANLNCHPEIFMPEIKEIHFFNMFLGLKSWEWYADLFRPGRGACKGEATPGYCDLPLETIRLIQSVLPRLKVIHLMRDPVTRAWSHAKHCFRHRTTPFVGCSLSFEQVTEEQWLDSFAELGSVRSGLYLKHLTKWLSVFPRSQIHVEFYDSIRMEPHDLLARTFRFLGVKHLDDFSSFPVVLTLNKGLGAKLSPTMRQYLCEMYADSVKELAKFLEDKFQRTLPTNWNRGTDAATKLNPARSDASGNDVSGGSESWSVAAPGRAPENEPPPGGPNFTAFEKRRLQFRFMPRNKADDFYGFSIVAYKDEFLAISRELGGVELRTLSKTDMRRLEEQGLLFRSELLEAVKVQVAARHLGELRVRT